MIYIFPQLDEVLVIVIVLCGMMMKGREKVKPGAGS